MVRKAKKTIDNNKALKIRLFYKDKIRRLTEIGFDWKAQSVTMKSSLFELHFEELAAIRAKHGRCSAKIYGEDRLFRR